jgi:hypothetical protein
LIGLALVCFYCCFGNWNAANNFFLIHAFCRKCFKLCTVYDLICLLCALLPTSTSNALCMSEIQLSVSHLRGCKHC